MSAGLLGEDQPSIFELEERLGIGHNNIHRALQIHGIPTRSSAEQNRLSWKRRCGARLSVAKAERLRVIAEIRRLFEQADGDGRELQRPDAEAALLTQEREELRARNRRLVEVLTLARNHVPGALLLAVAGVCQDCGAGLSSLTLKVCHLCMLRRIEEAVEAAPGYPSEAEEWALTEGGAACGEWQSICAR